MAEADFADFSKSLKPKKSIHDENFHWYCTVSPYRRQHFAPPSFNERFPEKHNANIHLIFGCANSGKYSIGLDWIWILFVWSKWMIFYFSLCFSVGDIQWSIPVETNKLDEKYLALPLYGDIKMTSYRENKTVKVLLEHIDFVCWCKLLFIFYSK